VKLRTLTAEYLATHSTSVSEVEKLKARWPEGFSLPSDPTDGHVQWATWSKCLLPVSARGAFNRGIIPAQDEFLFAADVLQKKFDNAVFTANALSEFDRAMAPTRAAFASATLILVCGLIDDDRNRNSGYARDGEAKAVV